MHSYYLYNFSLAMKYIPTMSLDQFTDSRRGEEIRESQLSDRLKPATVLILSIRYQKHSVSNSEIMHQRIALQYIHYNALQARENLHVQKTGIDYSAFIRFCQLKMGTND